jgi:hypothetical protein
MLVTNLGHMAHIGVPAGEVLWGRYMALDSQRRTLRVKRLVLILVLAAIAALFVVGTASADPVRNPNNIAVTYTCEGDEEVTLVFNPFVGVSAKHEVDDTSIWESMAGMRRFTNQETGEVIEVEGESPGQVEHNDLVRCTATYTFEGFLIKDTQFFLVTPQGDQD